MDHLLSFTLTEKLDGKVSSGSAASLGAIELSSGTPWIDFHYGHSNKDYTSRIIEVLEGVLDLECKELRMNNKNIATEAYVDGKFEASSKSLINGINFQENLTRTYQLEWGKAYLITVNAVDSGNAVIGNNSGVFFVFTAVDAGRSSSVKELWNAGYLTVSVDSNCLLSIQGAYRYLHYSITLL